MCTVFWKSVLVMELLSKVSPDDLILVYVNIPGAETALTGDGKVLGVYMHLMSLCIYAKFPNSVI